MLTIARLARAIEAVLPALDTAALLPRKRRHVARVPLATLLAAIIWFSCSSMTTWKRFVQLIHRQMLRLVSNPDAQHYRQSCPA